VFLNYEGIERSQELKNKAESLEARKRYEEAASALEEAAILNPKDTEIPGKIKTMGRKPRNIRKSRRISIRSR